MYALKLISVFILFHNAYSLDINFNSIEELYESYRVNFLDGNYSLNISPGCTLVLNKISPLTKIKLIDASSKLPNGLLNFNFFDVGNYDECYNLYEDVDGEDIYGKYCLSTVPVDISQFKNVNEERNKKPQLKNMGKGHLGLHLAYCLPSSCTLQDFSKIMIWTTFDERYCYSKAEPLSLDGSDIMAISVLVIFAILVVLSTGYDLYLYYTDRNPIHGILIAFSLWSNGKKIFHSSSNPEQLSCINGVKALSMVWVIYGHVNSTSVGLQNFMDFSKAISATKNMYLVAAPVSVDTFFAIGGILTVYTYLKACDKGISFNVPMFYVHRYLRLTPAFVIIIMLDATLVRYLGSGPFYGLMEETVTPCRKYWWSALLYIQNYVNPDEVCVPQSWYLSVDMQLFLISPLILFSLSQWPRPGLYGLLLFIAAGVVTPFLATYIMDLPGSMTTGDDMDGVEKYMYNYYFQTYTRFGPYVIGMLFGWVIYNLRKNKNAINMTEKNKQKIAWCLWLISIVGLIACVYAGTDVVTGKETGLVARSFYNSVNRNAWGLSVCIVVTLCCLGYGGPINAFLSISVFQFLAKLSYSMYLVHYTLVVTLRYLNAKVLTYFKESVMIHNFWGDFMITLMISFFLCAIFESPVIIIEKFIFGTGSKVPKKPQISKEISA